MLADMKTLIVCIGTLAGLVAGLRAETPVPAHTPQNVIIERFEARSARLSDALEALTVLAEKATNNVWHPSLTAAGDGIADRPVTLDVAKAPLSEVLDRICGATNLQVTYAKDSATISAKKN